MQTFTVDAADELTGITRAGTFTLNGATPAPVTSLAVNGNAAQTYGDFAFAGTNLTLVNGTNTFTIVATNLYGVRTTNIVAVVWPASVSLNSDNNGNLTNDGLRSFAYDAENQLTNVSVAGQWKSEFVYDGLNRRRISRDYSWNGSAWVKTNEVRLIYDGYQIIQERDTNNALQVTYTRGLDMSGTLDEAGGIGGLLARTDTNGSAYYHADGNGNVTALMDGRENMAARYLQDPFGRPIGQWGSMANVNVMQNSSKPVYHGIIDDGLRWRIPELDRFANQDPIQEQGGINPYSFVANNPVNYVDPLGLDYYVGGSREGYGHLWVAVDYHGGVLRYDFQQLGFEGAGSSLKDFLKSLYADGDVKPSFWPSADKAARGNEYYRYKSCPEKDAEIAKKMRDQIGNPPTYSCLFGNCADRGFQTLGLSNLEPGFNPLPSAFLDRANEFWKSSNNLIPPPTSLTYVNSVPVVPTR